MKLYGEPTLIMCMKGSSSGATLNFALRSKGGVASPVTCVTNLKSDAKHCNLHVLCDFCMEQSLLGTCGKLRKYQCFCSVLSKKHIVNTVVLGFRGATNIGVFCSESFKKTQTHKLFDNFRPLRD